MIAIVELQTKYWRILCFSSVCAFIIAWLFVECVWADPLPTDLVQLRTDESHEGAVRFLLSTKNVLRATVGVTFIKLDNFLSDKPPPINFVVMKPYNSIEYLRLTQIDASRPYTYYWKYSYKIGVPSSKPSAKVVYSIPYEGSHRVSQSYFGEHSHQRGTESEYAVDFVMPIGTKVRAARDGVVIAFYSDSNKGGSNKEFAHDANEIFIDHGDGTYSNYVHLKYKGVLVKLGQHVQAGDTIGLSGSTGWSTEPHLHFMVYRVLSAYKIQSLPFQMRTAGGVIDKPELNQSY